MGSFGGGERTKSSRVVAMKGRKEGRALVQQGTLSLIMMSRLYCTHIDQFIIQLLSSLLLHFRG